MKVTFVVLTLFGLALSAPQPKKLFHEHYEDFVDIIFSEVEEELSILSEHYMQYEEFTASIDYLYSSNFKDLVYEMGSLPEFKAVVDFLENNNIDFIYMFNNWLKSFDIKKKAILEPSGKDYNSFINDIINLFPKEKLAALSDQKIAEDEEFRVAMENLQSDEWDTVFNSLWESEEFQAEVNTLKENGVDVSLLIKQIIAIFGQN